MDGADRDCIALLNALNPEQFRVTWVGIAGCENLRPHVEPQVVREFLNVGLPPFSYLVRENANLQRSPWLWTKIIADHLLRMREALQKLQQGLRSDPPDVVITNTCTVWLGAMYALLNRLPHVWLIKDCMDPRVKACRVKARWMSWLSAAVIAPSSAVARPFRHPIHIFPDGTDVSAVIRGSNNVVREQVLQSLGLPVVRPVVAQIGTLEKIKGQHITAEAFVKLAAEKESPDFSLLFLGAERGDYRKQVEAILSGASQAWQNAVRFASFPPEDFSFMATADIVVHPSVIPDTFPNAVREAMILGKPVIASRDGGLPEMIDDGRTGILFETGNADELSQAMRRLIVSADERERIGEAARSFATSYFDINVRKHPFCELFYDLGPDINLPHRLA